MFSIKHSESPPSYLWQVSRKLQCSTWGLMITSSLGCLCAGWSNLQQSLIAGTAWFFSSHILCLIFTTWIFATFPGLCLFYGRHSNIKLCSLLKRLVLFVFLTHYSDFLFMFKDHKIIMGEPLFLRLCTNLYLKCKPLLKPQAVNTLVLCGGKRFSVWPV